MNSKQLKRLVVYHNECPDGFTAAWACWTYFGGKEHGTHYIPLAYGRDNVPDCTGLDVVFVDCALPRERLEEINSVASSLVVLDHHKTTMAAMKGLEYCIFDMFRSGAGLAWDHFHPGEARPWLIDYVEGRDLWTWAHPHNEAVCDGLDTFPRSFETYQCLAFGGTLVLDGDAHALRDGEDGFRLVLSVGKPILAYKRSQVTRACAKTRTITVQDYQVPSVNSCVLQSEIGNALMTGPADPPPFAVVWFRQADGRYRYSLRSVDSAVDVSEVAQAYGGGGHRNAAGFLTDHEIG